MLSRFRQHFGSAGLILGIIALVAVMAGSAYAAKKYIITSSKQIKPSVLKELQKPGPAGANGTNGSNGAKGDAGSPGQNGVSGKSIAVTSIAPGEEECEELGGVLVEKEGTPPGVEVCNGEEGAPGAPGQPWTPNNTLPLGAVETGTWAVNAAGAGEVPAPISFMVPLKDTLEGSKVHYFTDADFGTYCESPNAEIIKVKVNDALCARPSELVGGAETGFIGIYRTNNTTLGTSTLGAFLYFNMTEAGRADGIWAVKGN